MRINYKALLQGSAPLAALLTAAAAMAAIDPESKITIWLIGSGLSGLLFALRLCFFRPVKPESWKLFVANSKAAQRELNNSAYGIYRKIILGSPVPDNSLEYISIEDTVTHFIFMLACFSIGAVMWLEPTVIDFQLNQNTKAYELVKASLFQVVVVALLSAGFSGVFLKILRWFSPRQ